MDGPFWRHQTGLRRRGLVKSGQRGSLTGEVLEAGNGKVTKVVRRLASANPPSEIEWEFHLSAGKEQELNYQYKVLVRR